MEILTKRVYDPPAAADGYRVLVDRLWPQGLSKEKAALDLWDKDVAPSSELRKQFHHEDMDWPTFRAAYEAELADNGEALTALRGRLAGQAVATLLFASHDADHNNAVVLRDLLGD